MWHWNMRSHPHIPKNNLVVFPEFFNKKMMISELLKYIYQSNVIYSVNIALLIYILTILNVVSSELLMMSLSILPESILTIL